ncbi:MAG: hypothetical protein K0U52_05290 [Gammaproteobacteria bacterium]|nr:hypothetical protein [Gammaproteobacteria bacterium]
MESLDRVELLEILSQCSRSHVTDHHDHIDSTPMHVVQDRLIDDQSNKPKQPDITALIHGLEAIKSIPDEMMLDQIACISFVRGGIERLHMVVDSTKDYTMVFDLNIFQPLMQKYIKENSLTTKAKGWTETIVVVAVGFSLAMAAMGGVQNRN